MQRRWVVISGAVIVVLLMGGFAVLQGGGISPAKSADPEIAGDIPVVVTTATRQPVSLYVTGIGTAMARNSVTVTARVDGQLKKIHFEEGQLVKAGDPLAQIDPDPYKAEIERLRAILQRDRATLDNAQTDLKRYEELATRDYVARQKLDAQRALVQQTLAQIVADEAQIRVASVQLGYTSIVAPIDGRLGLRMIDNGNILRAADNTPIVTIVQSQPISVVVPISAKDAARAKLQPGPTNIPITALRDDGVTPLAQGTVLLIDNAVDAATGTIKLKAEFKNEDMALWPGTYVNCRIFVQSRNDGIAIPKTALRNGPRGDYIWVIRTDNTVESRGITVAQMQDTAAIVERGLRGGEVIVTEGHYKLTTGSRVSIKSRNPPVSLSQPGN